MAEYDDETPYSDGDFIEDTPQLKAVTVPTHDIFAERAVIGACLRDNEQYEKCAAIIKPDDFSQFHHMLVWNIIGDFHKLGAPWDMVSVCGEIVKRGKAKDFGISVQGYVNDCWNEGCISVNATMYADTIKRHSQKRDQVRIAAQLLREAKSGVQPEEFSASFIAASEEMSAGAAPTGWYPKPLTWAKFKASVKPVEYLCEKIMTRGQPMVWGGPMKAMKTSTLVDFCISLATSTPFLGKFAVNTRRRVWLMSAESGGAAILSLVQRICKSKGLDPDVVLNNDYFHIQLDMPMLSNEAEMARFTRAAKKGQYDVTAFDPTYLSLLAGGDGETNPGNIMAMGPLYKSIGNHCFAAGATPILAFHANKVNAAACRTPLELHQLSYAGISEFAGQWFLPRRCTDWRPGVNELVIATGGRDDGRGTIFELVIREYNAAGEFVWELEHRDFREPAANERQGEHVEDGAAFAAAEAAAERNEWAQVFEKCYAFLKTNDTKHEGMTYKGMREAIRPKVHDRDAEAFKMKILNDARFEEVLVKVAAGHGFRDYPGIRLKGEFRQQEIFDDKNG